MTVLSSTGVFLDHVIAKCLRSTNGFSRNMPFTSEIRAIITLLFSTCSVREFLLSGLSCSHSLDSIRSCVRAAVLVSSVSVIIPSSFFKTRRNGVHDPRNQDNVEFCRVSQACFCGDTFVAISLSFTLLLDVHHRFFHQHCKGSTYWDSTDPQRRLSGTLCPRKRCQKVVSPLVSSVLRTLSTECVFSLLPANTPLFHRKSSSVSSV